MLSLYRPLTRIGPTLSRLVSTNALPQILEMEKDVPKSSGLASSSSPSSFATYNPLGPPIKPFRPGRHIIPKHMSYEFRTKEAPVPKIRPGVGPSASDSKYSDYFHQLNTDPLEHCLNTSILSSFVSEMGRIRARRMTGLTRKNQRKIGKAIRRAKMMGIIPIFSRRPLRKASSA